MTAGQPPEEGESTQGFLNEVRKALQGGGGAGPTDSAIPAPSPAPPPPQRIGPYRILSVLGEGGMGTVYLAEQTEPIRRRVALKLIKAGMDSKQVIARFESERQALALMSHPNIAAVLDAGYVTAEDTGPTPDAGATAGRPYFVMEYVPGEPITAYCDRHRLSLPERLGLFMQVCHAVQHAHTKAVLHRDVKPSNILVMLHEGRPTPKLIDFGVARATNQRLTERTLFTEHGQLIGTPEYMSPEQAEMAQVDIDTRTDIYSLGVLLYELLTGTLPFDPQSLRRAAYAEIQRIIREVEPPRPSTRLSSMLDDRRRIRATGEHGRSDRANAESGPEAPAPGQPARSEEPVAGAAGSDRPSSLAVIAIRRRSEPRTLVRHIRGDLDWIVMKCLEKDRTRRYETANGLAMEIRRYLDHEPVLAGPPGVGYRIGKFVRRNRGPVIAAGAFALVLATGAGGMTGLYLRAEQQRARAVAAEAEQSRERQRAEDEAERARLAEGEQARARAEAERVREEAEWDAYVANIGAAKTALEHNEMATVRARLAACPQRFRGWEWRHLDARADDSLAVLRGHEDMVKSAAFSPDGARVVTASQDNTARLWDVATGRETAVLRGHQNWVWGAAFSRDGARVVTASEDQTARLWDAATGRELVVLRGHLSGVDSAAFSPDGARVLTASWDRTARLWDAAMGRELAVLRGHKEMLMSAAFSPDGVRVVTASWDKTARLWDAATGRELAVLRGHEDPLMSATFSPDGIHVVTASKDKTARLWDAATGRQKAVLRGHADLVRSAAFSPDGARVLTGSMDGTAMLWDAATGRETAVLRGHADLVRSAAFSPDGTRVLTVSRDNTARLWDAATGRELAVLRGHEGDVVSAAFSPEGTRVVTASKDNTARLWDAATNRETAVLRGHEGGVDSAAFNPDGTRVLTVSRDKTARLWDAATGRKTAVLRGHEGQVVSAAFSPDGTRVLTASRDNTARLWDAATGRELAVLRGHEGDVVSAAFSPEGTRVVTASWDKTARVRDAATGREMVVLRGHELAVNSAAFSPDGTRVVTASWDKTARVWDAATGREMVVLRGHEDVVRSAAFRPDGTHVVTASWDKAARVWDAATGREVAVLRGHELEVNSAAFSLDGTRVATASSDRTVRLWDAATGRETTVLRAHEGMVMSAAFSPDGFRLVTASDDTTAHLWDTVPYRVRFASIEAIRKVVKRIRPRIEEAIASEKTTSDLADEIQADRTLSGPERTAAQIVLCETSEKAAEGTRRKLEADLLEEAAWYAVSRPQVSQADADRAVVDARQATRLDPGNGFILTTLGVALYRVGRRSEALETLRRAEVLNSRTNLALEQLPAGAAATRPSDLSHGESAHLAEVAFIAMSLNQLGRKAEARAELERLRCLMNSSALDLDEEHWSFLDEAEALIEGHDPTSSPAAGDGHRPPEPTDAANSARQEPRPPGATTKPAATQASGAGGNRP
jgi:WD40 repeat protein/serine/threonine protein kinase